MKILVVDREDDLRRVLDILEQTPGNEIQWALTGQEAIDMTHGKQVDLLITEVFLDPMNGFTLRNKMENRHAGVRTIFVTGYDLSAYTEHTSGYEIIAKPATPQKLFPAIARTMGGVGSLAAPAVPKVQEPSPAPRVVAAPAAQPTAVPRVVAAPATQPAAVPRVTAVPVAQPAAVPRVTAVPASQPAAAPRVAAVPVVEQAAVPGVTAVSASEQAPAPRMMAAPVAQPAAVPRVTAAPVAQPAAVPRVAAAPVAQPAAVPRVTAAPVAQPAAVPRVTAAPVAQPAAVPRVIAAPVAQPAAVPRVTAAPVAQPVAVPRVTTAPVAQPVAVPRVIAAPAAEQASVPTVKATPGFQPSPVPRVAAAPQAEQVVAPRVTATPVAQPAAVPSVTAVPAPEAEAHEVTATTAADQASSAPPDVESAPEPRVTAVPSVEQVAVPRVTPVAEQAIMEFPDSEPPAVAAVPATEEAGLPQITGTPALEQAAVPEAAAAPPGEPAAAPRVIVVAAAEPSIAPRVTPMPRVTAAPAGSPKLAATPAAVPRMMPKRPAAPMTTPKATAMPAAPREAEAARVARPAPAAVPDPFLGKTLGSYRIERRLGRGKWGPVYLAIQTSMNRPVAMEMLAPEKAGEEAARQNFVATARAKAAVQHPHILSVYEADQAEGHYFYTHEYVDGFTLAQLAARGEGLSEPMALQTIKYVAQGLSHMHHHKIAHSIPDATDIYIGTDGLPYLSNVALPTDDMPAMQEEICTLGKVIRSVLPGGQAQDRGLQTMLNRMAITNQLGFQSWPPLFQAIQSIEPKVVPADAFKLSAQDQAAIRAVEAARKRQKMVVIASVAGLVFFVLFLAGVIWWEFLRPEVHDYSDDMVKIEAGAFIYQDGQKLTLPAFYVDKYEVTMAEYEKFLDDLKAHGNPTTYDSELQPAGRSHVPRDWDILYGRASSGFPGYRTVRNVPISLDCPVFNVDYFDAYAYAKWKGRRLPTQQEWEKAARGPSGNLYPWGNQWDPTKLNAGGDYQAEPPPGYKPSVDGFTCWAPVDALPGDRSPYGVIGMAGNVSEWTNSWDPSKTYVFIRGGNYKSTSEQALATSFIKVYPQQVAETLGFRTASDNPPAK